MLRFSVLAGLLPGIWLWAGLVSAQTPVIPPADTIRPPIDKVQIDAGAYLPKATPVSPTVAALGRYGDIPVSLYSGLPTIEIPIFDFTVDGLTVPIKLTYHASGLKVSDQASWVGMGWSLQTGGMITRQILGLPDEKPGAVGSALISRSLSALASPTNTTNGCFPDNSTEKGLYDGMAENRVDGQRDVFTYRTPKATNSFIVQQNPATNLITSTFLVPEKTQIQSTTNLTSFTLVDESGSSYRFTDTENSGSDAVTWLLNEIVGLNASQRAIYRYTTVASATSNDITDAQTTIDQRTTSAGPPESTSTVTVQNNNTTTSQRLLTQLVFPGGKIEFGIEARTSPDESAGSRLRTIDIYGTKTDNTYALIKRYQLNYVYKARTGVGSTLFLDNLQLLDVAGVSIGRYSFAYNATPLPEQQSRARDFWGYANGQTTNTTLIPAQTIPWQPSASSSPGTITIGGGNREPNASSMTAWMLQRLTYPTGGYTDFDYEPHQYLNATVKLAGGLRIRQIRSYSAAGVLARTKTYAYGTNGTGTPRFGRAFANSARPETYVASQIIQYFDATASNGPVYSYRQRTFSSAPSYPLSSAEGSPVTYATVTEYEDEGTATIGRTVHTFKDDEADAPIYANGRLFVKNTAWNRGQLLTQTVYDAANRRKYRLEHEYTKLVSGTTTNEPAGLLVTYSIQDINGSPSGSCSRYFPNSAGGSFGVIPNYTFDFGLVKRVRTREYGYDDTNDARYTLKTTETDYSPSFYLPIETRTTAEGNIVLGTRLSYPQNFTRTIPTNADADLLGIKTLQARNAYLPVETINFRQDLPDLTKYYKTGKLTTYNPFTINSLATALPRHVYLPETDFNNKVIVPNPPTTGNPNPDYKPSATWYNEGTATTGTEFPVDRIWKSRLTMTSYDPLGNLTGYSLTAGASTTMSYGTYTPAGGVPFSVLASETQNAGQPSAQTSVFSYQIPLLGVANMFAPNNLKTSYEYDAFGRLARIKDNSGNVLKQFIYRYGTAP